MYQAIKAGSDNNTIGKKIASTMSDKIEVAVGHDYYSRAGIGGIGIASAFLGIWGLTCLISGLAGSSEHDLLRNLLTAIIGF